MGAGHAYTTDVDIKNQERKIATLEEYDWAMEILFGDNVGAVSGPVIGCLMHYEGRYIYFKDGKIAYMTEQNH